MAKTYALLVGIDRYLGLDAPLYGCVADVNAMRTLLQERVPDVHILVLTDEQATRDGVVAAFNSHLGRATGGDTAIFWYAGHGSQARTSSPAGVEPDGLDETLVLHDSRTPGQHDLVDKELGALIAGIARPDVHVLVGLDCCHSGSGTRELLPEGYLVRRAPTDLRERDGSAVPVAAAGTAAPPSGSGWRAGGRHVLLAACRADQTAKEVPLAGEHRGALTAAVQQALRGIGPAQTYRDLLRMVRSALAMQLVPDQVAQLEVTRDGDDLRTVFNGGLTAKPPHYVASFDAPGDRWIIDGGAVHGIPSMVDEMRLALYPLDADLDPLGTPLVTTGIRQVLPQLSVLDLSPGALDTARSYAAVVAAWPLPKAAVAVTTTAATDPAVAAAVRDRINASPFMTEATGGDLLVALAGTSCSVIDQARGPAPVAVWDRPVTMATVGDSLEQIVRYRQVLGLDNPGSSITPAMVRLEINASEFAIRRPGEVTFPYVTAGAATVAQRFTITVRNTADRTLWCAVLVFGDDYSISAAALPGNIAMLKAGEAITSTGITAGIPDPLWDAGVVRQSDTVQLIVSTEQFDPMLPVQDGLPNPALRLDRTDRSATPGHSLDRLLRRVQERALVFDATDSTPIVDWATQSIRITTERPRPGVDLGRDAVLVPGVRIQVPDGVSGTVTATSLDLVSRDALAPLIPPLLVGQPEIWSAFSFQSERGGSPPLDVLELRDIVNAHLVTPDRPIILTRQGPIPDGESVLVIGFDGINYLPVGHTTAVAGEIRIEQLPPAIDGRSLFGSIRLLFRRLVNEVTHRPAVETRLAIATVAPSGQVQYDDNEVHLHAQVATATRVLLLVHGILGDTRGMVLGSAAPAAPGRPSIAGGYDLVLAFDYENINTPVSITAASLLAKLRAAGFDDQPGRTLYIVAHSMGGLVTRWMIELLGGAGIVHRLVTAGTPNNGSPWPVVEDWAVVTLSFALNQLAQVFWPAHVAAHLVKLIEKVDGALDDMSPDSDRLKTLFAAPDPDLAYHVLIGDRALAIAPLSGGRVQALLKALQRRSVDVATDLAFFGKVNDLAVSVDSALHIPGGRSPSPVVVQNVKCDHVTYFSSDDGLAKIAAALA